MWAGVFGSRPLFCKPVRGMSIVFKGVTVWAKHLKIAEVVVAPIPVLMVDAENLRVGVKPAPFARGKDSPALHGFSHCRECRLPFAFFSFVYASLAAKFSVLRWGASKRCAAMRAQFFDRPPLAHGFAVALFRAIFCGIASGAYVCKVVAAVRAVRGDFCPMGERTATARAEFKAVPSVFGDMNICSAMQARQHFVGDA